MKMWRKELTFVLLTVTMVAIAGEDLVILDKKQRNVTRPLGSSLTLGCSLVTQKLERYRMSLYFNPSGCTFTSAHQIYAIFRVANESTVTLNKRKLQEVKGISSEDTVLRFMLLNATEADSGWYFCTLRAEIPDLGNGSSNGTEVIIKPVATTPSNPPTDWWLWILVGVSAVILTVLLIVCILMKRKYSRRRAAADPIYANTYRRSPRPGKPVGNLKTVSSSKDLQNPSPAMHGNNRRRDKLGRSHEAQKSLP